MKTRNRFKIHTHFIRLMSGVRVLRSPLTGAQNFTVLEDSGIASRDPVNLRQRLRL